MSHHVLRRSQPVTVKSYDPETRTGEAVIASDQTVEGIRIDFRSFFAAGTPDRVTLQPDHNNSVVEKRGEWTDLRIEQAEDGAQLLVGRFALSRRTDNEGLHTLLSEGMLRGVSVAFNVSKWRAETDPATGKKVRVALEGKLVEASFVNNPADPRATVRSQSMEHENINSGEGENVTRSGLSADQFETICRSAGVPQDVIDALAASDAPDAERLALARAAIPEKPTVRSGGGSDHNAGSLDNPTVLRAAAVEAFDIVIRGEEATGQAAALLGEGEAGIARRILRAAGQSTFGLSDETVKRNAAATDDYAIIAGSTFNLAMRREFEAVKSPLSDMFGRDTVSTFNDETRGLVDWTTLAMGDKLENGEYKYSFVDESGETIGVTVRGGITALSWELSINSVGRLGSMAQKQGKRYAADQADQQVAFLEQNGAAGPKMSDGKAVFHANRGNIEAFAQTPETMVSDLFKLRAKMARRKGAGNVMIGDYPTHWLVHPDYEETAIRLLASITASSVAEVNPLAGKLAIVAEPRLTDPATSWLAVEPSKMDGAVRFFLRGHEAPHTESRQKWSTDALEFKIRHAFGLGWLEWRSWTRLDHV